MLYWVHPVSTLLVIGTDYIYSETCLNRTLIKPKTCLNQTYFTVSSTKCLCNLNLCKPNTCLNWTNSSVPKGFGLDRFLLYIGSCKSIYHAIMTMTGPMNNIWIILVYRIFICYFTKIYYIYVSRHYY